MDGILSGHPYLGMKFEFVNALSVAEVVLNAVHGGRVEHPHDAPGSGRGQDRPAVVRVVGPGAGVEVLVGIRIRVTLEEFVVAGVHSLVEGDAVVAHRGEHGGLITAQVMVDAHPEDGLQGRKVIIILLYLASSEFAFGSNPTYLTVVLLPEPGAFVVEFGWSRSGAAHECRAFLLGRESAPSLLAPAGSSLLGRDRRRGFAPGCGRGGGLGADGHAVRGGGTAQGLEIVLLFLLVLGGSSGSSCGLVLIFHVGGDWSRRGSLPRLVRYHTDQGSGKISWRYWRKWAEFFSISFSIQSDFSLLLCFSNPSVNVN